MLSVFLVGLVRHSNIKGLAALLSDAIRQTNNFRHLRSRLLER